MLTTWFPSTRLDARTKESHIRESSRAGKLVGIMKTNVVKIALAMDKLTVTALSQNICVRARKMVNYA